MGTAQRAAQVCSGNAFLSLCELCCARRAFVRTIVPQGLNNGSSACSDVTVALVCADMEPEQESNSSVLAI